MAMVIDPAFSRTPVLRLNLTSDSGLCLFNEAQKHLGALRKAGVFPRHGGNVGATRGPQVRGGDR